MLPGHFESRGNSLSQMRTLPLTHQSLLSPGGFLVPIPSSPDLPCPPGPPLPFGLNPHSHSSLEECPTSPQTGRPLPLNLIPELSLRLTRDFGRSGHSPIHMLLTILISVITPNHPTHVVHPRLRYPAPDSLMREPNPTPPCGIIASC